MPGQANRQITWTLSSYVGRAGAYRYVWAEDKRRADGSTPAGDVEVSRHSIRAGAPALALHELHPDSRALSVNVGRTTAAALRRRLFKLCRSADLARLTAGEVPAERQRSV